MNETAYQDRLPVSVGGRKETSTTKKGVGEATLSGATLSGVPETRMTGDSVQFDGRTNIGIANLAMFFGFA